MAYVNCPLCGKPGASKFLWMVKCPHQGCLKYNSRIFSPGANGVIVSYRNHADEDKKFFGDATTLRRRGEHLSLCLAPTGQRCTFRRDRLRNLQELESRMPAEES